MNTKTSNTSLVPEPDVSVKAGNWDFRYNNFSPQKKQKADEFARDMFHADFLALDTNDQERVIRALSTNWMMEEKSRLIGQVELKDGRVVGTSGVMIDTLPDLYNDICTKTCLKDMVEQIHDRKMTMDLEHETFRGDHTASLNKATIPISKIIDAEYTETKDGHGRVQIKDLLNTHNHRYLEVAGSIKDGYLTAYSIAYRPEKVSYKSIGGTNYRILDRVSLLNVTYTGVPVNPRAEIGGVQMKSQSGDNEFFLKIANGEGVDAKSVDSESFAIEAKSKDGVPMAKSVEQKAEEPVAEPAKESSSSAPEPAPAPATDSLENVLKEILARLAAVEAKVSSNDTQPAPPSEAKADEPPAESTKESPPEEKKEEETEQKSVMVELASLKAKIAEHEKILATPFVKGARSQMDAELKSQEATVRTPSILQTF